MNKSSKNMAFNSILAYPSLAECHLKQIKNPIDELINSIIDGTEPKQPTPVDIWDDGPDLEDIIEEKIRRQQEEEEADDAHESWWPALV